MLSLCLSIAPCPQPRSQLETLSDVEDSSDEAAYIVAAYIDYKTPRLVFGCVIVVGRARSFIFQYCSYFQIYSGHPCPQRSEPSPLLHLLFRSGGVNSNPHSG